MKILVTAKGARKNDFCWTIEGELVLLPSFVCASETTCGCGRAFVGVTTRRGTTVAEVARARTSARVLANKDCKGFFGPRWGTMLPSEKRVHLRAALERVTKLAAMIKDYPVGTCVRMAHVNGGGVEIKAVTP